MKKIFFNLISVILMMPMIASAQWNIGGVDDGGLPGRGTGTIVNILTKLMYWLLILLGIFGVIGFVVSGIMYLTAAGDDDRMESAKKAMQWSIIGIIVGLVGFVIIQAVNTMLGGASSVF